MIYVTPSEHLNATMSEPGTEIPISRGMEITPGSQLVVADPQDTDFSFEEHPGCTTHFDPAGRTSFRLSEHYCVATIIGAIPNRVRKQSIRLLMVDNG